MTAVPPGGPATQDPSAISPGPANTQARPAGDRISLLGLRALGRHGVFPGERARGQEFIVDAVLWLDTRPAAARDDLALTVDYGRIAERLAAVIAGEPVALIETLAERLAAECLADGRVSHAEITVHKPAAPVRTPLRDVTVTILRSRS